jgi:hypothetical protein
MKNYCASFCVFGLFILFFIGYPTESKAGCPTDIAPTNIAWSSHTRNFQIAGTDCIVSVKFCKRPVNGTWEYFIDEVKPLAGHWDPECDDLKWIDLVNDIRTQLLLDPDDVGPCGGELETITTVYTGQCVIFSIQNGDPVANFCNNAYCKKTCEVCINLTTGLKELTNCSTSVLGLADCGFVTGIEDVTFGDINQQ